MSDNELKKGDICIYQKTEGTNNSLLLVEVTKVCSEFVCKIRVLQAIIDNGKTDWVRFLLERNNEMTSSTKYLHKIDLFSRHNEIENRQRREIESLQSDIQILVDNSLKRTEVELYIKNKATKDTVGMLKGIIKNELCLTANETDYLCMRIDDEMKKVIGE